MGALLDDFFAFGEDHFDVARVGHVGIYLSMFESGSA